eukprot:5509958-Pleurochrysis_carterae.AAC.8
MSRAPVVYLPVRVLVLALVREGSAVRERHPLCRAREAPSLPCERGTFSAVRERHPLCRAREAPSLPCERGTLTRTAEPSHHLVLYGGGRRGGTELRA